MFFLRKSPTRKIIQPGTRKLATTPGSAASSSSSNSRSLYKQSWFRGLLMFIIGLISIMSYVSFMSDADNNLIGGGSTSSSLSSLSTLQFLESSILMNNINNNQEYGVGNDSMLITTARQTTSSYVGRDNDGFGGGGFGGGGGEKGKQQSLQIDKQDADASSSSTTKTNKSNNDISIDDPDADCPFRHSSIYRKVYVYPNRGEYEHGWGDSKIMSDVAMQNLSAIPDWPWLYYDTMARTNATGHYNINSQNVQYTTELLVRELMINPKSCLRTYDPEQATLFYIPYLPSIEHHQGHDHITDYTFSPFGKAIVNILDNDDYTAWERLYGFTSKYWKRRQGSDHILVFSEPMHGLWHPRSKRGNYHFIHSQYQLRSPIVISVELSTSFVKRYPKCAAKNILVPYPNTDGRWFNGYYERAAKKNMIRAGYNVTNSQTSLPNERRATSIATSANDNKNTGIDSSLLYTGRPVGQFYKAGNHGTCTKLRRSMQADYSKCTKHLSVLDNQLYSKHYTTAMRLSTFCPCPGGDSPSAKRMFDSIIAGCIPVVLSYDYVWPFTAEFDADTSFIEPATFSIRLNATQYTETLLDHKTCKPHNTQNPGLQSYFESISANEIAKYRQGMINARHHYSWYEYRSDIPINPLRDGVLPTGGTAHTVIRALEDRASGAKWSACQEENIRTSKITKKDPTQFKC